MFIIRYTRIVYNTDEVRRIACVGVILVGSNNCALGRGADSVIAQHFTFFSRLLLTCDRS